MAGLCSSRQHCRRALLILFLLTDGGGGGGGEKRQGKRRRSWTYSRPASDRPSIYYHGRSRRKTQPFYISNLLWHQQPQLLQISEFHVHHGGETGKTIIIYAEGGREESTTTTMIPGRWSTRWYLFAYRRRWPISTLEMGTTTITTKKNTTTTSDGSPLSNVPLPRPEPQRGLGDGRTGRGDAAGPVPGSAVMMMTMLGSGLELVENSKYPSLSWTRGNTLPHQIPKPSMKFPCTAWTWRTRPIGRRRWGWGRWIGWRIKDTFFN